MTTTTRQPSFCRICSAACGVLVEVADDRVVAVHGDRENPLSAGYLCVKGRASADQHNGEDRLFSSRRREESGGTAEDIDLETALDEVHERLSAIVERWGPESVALYYGTGVNTNTLTHSAMKAWMEGLGSPYVYSSMTLDQSAKWVTMGRLGMYTGGKRNAYDADVLLMVGSNPAVSHASPLLPMANPSKRIREGQAAGQKLIVVDPRRTETAKLADIHVPVRPGEDATLFAGLIHLVFERDLVDHDFCDRYLGPLDTLRAAVAEFTPEYVAARAGVPAEVLLDVAVTFAGAARKSAASGTGPNMARDSNLTEHLIEAFNAICGGYRRVGDKVWNTGGLYGSMPAVATVVPPLRSWEHGPKCRSADIGAIAGEFPTSVLPAEILHDGPDRIRALVVVGGDLARALPDPDRTLAALDALELLVTVEQRPTETGARSHYEIATSLPFERHDLTGALDIYFARTFAQVTRPIVARPTGVIDDWEFFAGLARRAGTPMRMKQAFFGLGQEHIPGDSLDLDPLAPPPTTEDIVRWMSGLGALSYEELLAHPHGFAPDSETTLADVPDDGARLDPCPPDVAAELDGVRARHRAGDDPGYPLLLISRRMAGSMNSAFRKAAKVSRHTPHNPAYLCPDDIAAFGLTDGGPARIESPAGSVQARVCADDTLPPGTASMAHSWGPLLGQDPGDPGAFSGRLISLTENRQTINYMPLQSAIPVRVVPVA